MSIPFKKDKLFILTEFVLYYKPEINGRDSKVGALARIYLKLL